MGNLAVVAFEEPEPRETVLGQCRFELTSHSWSSRPALLCKHVWEMRSAEAGPSAPAWLKVLYMMQTPSQPLLLDPIPQTVTITSSP